MSSPCMPLILALQRSPPLAQVVVEMVEGNRPFSASSGGAKTLMQTLDNRMSMGPKKAIEGAHMAYVEASICVFATRVLFEVYLPAICQCRKGSSVF